MVTCLFSAGSEPRSVASRAGFKPGLPPAVLSHVLVGSALFSAYL